MTAREGINIQIREAYVRRKGLGRHMNIDHSRFLGLGDLQRRDPPCAHP